MQHIARKIPDIRLVGEGKDHKELGLEGLGAGVGHLNARSGTKEWSKLPEPVLFLRGNKSILHFKDF